MPRVVAERADAVPTLAEMFRARGFEGTTLSMISEATGLGKGSLYHFFPGGKAEMGSAVLDEIDAWFETNIFAPLRSADEPLTAIEATLDAVSVYFRSGRRVCLMGVLALGDARNRFSDQVNGFFARWIEALGEALARSGSGHELAGALAEETVTSIQGAIVLAGALRQTEVFENTINRLRTRLAAGTAPTRGERAARSRLS